MTRARDVADTQDNLGGAVPPVVAGKNLIINGGFDIWQRGTTLNAVSHNTYTADQWLAVTDSIGTVNVTQQNIAAQGLGSNYALRFEKSAGASNRVVLIALVEGALNYVGKKVTFSGYLRKGSGLTADIIVDIGTRASKFGTQYDGIVSSTISNASLNSSTFTKFSYTFDVTTLTSTNNANLFEIEIKYTQAGGANVFLEFASMQIEAGAVATPFARAGGTLQGELAACQRYYFRTGGVQFGHLGIIATASSSTTLYGEWQLPVQMRAVPTTLDFSGVGWIVAWGGGVATITNITIFNGAGSVGTTKDYGVLQFTTTGATTGAKYPVISNNSTAAYLGIGAEL